MIYLDKNIPLAVAAGMAAKLGCYLVADRKGNVRITPRPGPDSHIARRVNSAEDVDRIASAARMAL